MFPGAFFPSVTHFNWAHLSHPSHSAHFPLRITHLLNSFSSIRFPQFVFSSIRHERIGVQCRGPVAHARAPRALRRCQPLASHPKGGLRALGVPAQSLGTEYTTVCQLAPGGEAGATPGTHQPTPRASAYIRLSPPFFWIVCACSLSHTTHARTHARIWLSHPLSSWLSHPLSSVTCRMYLCALYTSARTPNRGTRVGGPPFSSMATPLLSPTGNVPLNHSCSLYHRMPFPIPTGHPAAQKPRQKSASSPQERLVNQRPLTALHTHTPTHTLAAACTHVPNCTALRRAKLHRA